VPTISQVAGSTFGVDANGNPVANVQSIFLERLQYRRHTNCPLCDNASPEVTRAWVIGSPNASGVYASANGAIKGE